MRRYNRSYIDDNGVKVKVCGRCNDIYPYTIEYFGSRGKYGMSAYCIKCTLEVSKKSKAENRTRIGEYKPRVKYRATQRDGKFYKICSKCGKELPHTKEYFDAIKNGERGLQSKCRECRLDKNRLDSKIYWARELVAHARTSAHRKGLEFSISTEDVLNKYSEQNGRCYWTGVKLEPSSKIKYPFQPSLDRLDCSKGYVKENVVVCSFVANMGRNNNSQEEFQKFLLALEKELDYTQWQN